MGVLGESVGERKGGERKTEVRGEERRWGEEGGR